MEAQAEAWFFSFFLVWMIPGPFVVYDLEAKLITEGHPPDGFRGNTDRYSWVGPVLLKAVFNEQPPADNNLSRTRETANSILWRRRRQLDRSADRKFHVDGIHTNYLPGYGGHEPAASRSGS